MPSHINNPIICIVLYCICIITSVKHTHVYLLLFAILLQQVKILLFCHIDECCIVAIDP